MGLFNLFGKREKSPQAQPSTPPQKAVSRTRSATIGVSELMYAYMKQGKPWGDDSLTWNMKNAYPSLRLANAHSLCVSNGIIREATTEEKLDFVTFTTIKEICKGIDIKPKRTKGETIAELVSSCRMDEIAHALPDRITVLSASGKALMQKHNYIPYLVKEGKYCNFDYESMWKFRNLNEFASISAVLEAGIDEGFIADALFDDAWEDIDEDEYGMTQEKYEKDLRRESERDARKEAKELLAKVKKDIADGKVGC